MKIKRSGYWVFDCNGWVRGWGQTLREAELKAMAIENNTEIREVKAVVVLRTGRDLLKLSHVRPDRPCIVY